MANNLSDIVAINVDIASPSVDSASFDHMLIFGPAPKVTPTSPLPKVGVYSDLTEVADAGYVSEGEGADPIGVAARVAFAQNPKPSSIFVAAQQPYLPLISNAVVTLITADNYLTNAVGADSVTGIPQSLSLPMLQITYDQHDALGMDIEIIKDGVTRFGKTLSAETNGESYVQVCIGAATGQYDQMSIPTADSNGAYTVILTGTKGHGKTIVTLEGTLTASSVFAPGAVAIETVPVMQTSLDALKEAIGTSGWYVACAAGVEESQFEEIAAWTETQAKLFAYTFLQKTDPVSASYFRTIGVYGLITDTDLPEDVPEANAYLHIAMTAKCLAYPAGSETWAYKQLAVVRPTQASSILRKQLTDGHSNYFAQYAGKNITMNGQVRSGEWIDIIRGRDWLENDMQLRLFNLFLENAKIPYENGGPTKVQNEMIASLKAAQDRGIVAKSEYDVDGKLVPGYTTSVPNVMNLTSTQRASRVLRECRFSARMAGAIQMIQANGTLTY